MNGGMRSEFWAPNTGWVLCDCYFPNGKPVPFSTRQLYRDALGQLSDAGFDYFAGLEVEFHLLKIENHNLVLFGDPGSNAVLAKVIARLPLTWNKKAVSFAGGSYNPDRHTVPLIFPNPLNPRKYVVLNSGHSFHEKEFRASNAQLYPRLGDGGVVRFKADGKGSFVEEIFSPAMFPDGQCDPFHDTYIPGLVNFIRTPLRKWSLR